MDDPKRFKFEGNEHYLKSAAEMRQLFREMPEACDNTLWIAERADVEIEFGKPKLPSVSPPEGFADADDYLRHLTYQGAEAALRHAVAGARWSSDWSTSSASSPAWGSRDYFLVVWDLIRHAREQGHPGGARAGQRGGLLRGLLPAHRRPRPDPLRPAVRAVPQPRAQADARHRHGLRRAVPGGDDPLRGRALRMGPRGPDRHLLHHQGAAPRSGTRPGCWATPTASATASPRPCRRS